MDRDGHVVGSAAVFALTNPVQAYAWGAVDGVAALTGTERTGGPEAELWVGAHPAAPSRLADGRSLDRVVADDPDGLLGAEVAARVGDRLPFLLKVLAIGAPLSIQLHPSAAQATAGFAREEAAGIGRDDPRRTYRDAHAKPEVVVAVEPTWVLGGFRTGADAADLLGRNVDPALAEVRATVVGQRDARAGLIHILSVDDAGRTALAAAAARVDDDGPALGWVRRLAAAHPGDPTALAPLLLELRHLAPGEGMFLPAGVPHAYLRGAGVELMGASDNVVRGGLTPKHVDRDELVRLLAPVGTSVELLPGEPRGGSDTSYDPGVAELALHRVDLGADPVPLASDAPGPALALALGGAVTACTDDEVEVLTGGRALFIPASERDVVRVSGPGTLWWATVGSAPPPG